MDKITRYRGRDISIDDIQCIRELIAANPDLSRRALSKKLCEAWNWVQPNGTLRDMVARGLMLHLHRAGHIKLPAKRQSPPNNVALHRRPKPLPLLTWSPVTGPLKALKPFKFRQVRRSDNEGLFNSFIETHHYLGYTQPVGEHLKYIVYSRGRPIACFAWSSAPRHLGPRDRYIGWSPDARRRNIRYLAYNTRFLILPWVQVKYLASHLLAQMSRLISSDWERVYDHPVHYLETFVDTTRFAGTCYRAANWVSLGLTTGRGKDDQTGLANRSLKEVMGYPLTKQFRQQLSRI
jgi:hypothetical protein